MSKERERAQQRARAKKAEERRERAVRARRRRTVIVTAVVICVVLALVIVVNQLDGDGPGEGASPTPTAVGYSDPDDTADTTGTADTAPTTEAPGYDAPPPPSEARNAEVIVQTSQGDLTLDLDADAAPQAVASFEFLTEEGFFDGTSCHRLLPSALLQCGDPTGTGTGGPGYSFGPIENAPTDQIYPAGTVAMARVGGQGDSMGSQFFLVFEDTPLPDDAAGGYTVMGTITSGLDVLRQIGAAGTVDGSSDGRPKNDVIIESMEIT
ncbi:peptidylprolyl isomerase [Pseudactinotalea sp. HY158]|uniref:peptidylprolyl isomerase n=1 Tax=Pseudactinotalea sp. HY158 TaxID=2654547 RepID=UPI00129CAE22|nr:peptidylprolyl isomerase [Pseudactinotalea sp. HY158]QGH69346.1 peptidylprolyl isomerase [Pseudactinotalea sp. HY158]